MTVEEIVELLHAIERKPLNPARELVLRQSWNGKTYTAMAVGSVYEVDYLKTTAARVWQVLSQVFGIPINKANLRATLEPRPLSRSQRRAIDQFHSESEIEPEFKPVIVPDYPSGPLPLTSQFYIERPPVEALAYAEIAEPGSITRLKAPRRMGKSSLMVRILNRAKALRYHSVMLDMQQADRAVSTDLDKFLRWFATLVTHQLQLDANLDDYWDEDIGSKISCTIYFQSLLERLDAPLVLALNEINRVFEYPHVASEFLPLLRSWHEHAKQIEVWTKLRLVVAYSTEIYIPLNLNQSPFNVGLPVKLPPFTPQQVRDLAGRYGFNWQESDDPERLMALVGGHPYLIQLAFYHLCRQDIDLTRLLAEAATESSIYNAYLRQLLSGLQAAPEVGEAFERTIASPEGVQLSPMLAYQLDSMGLIAFEGDRAVPSCELYRQYFAKVFALERDARNDRLQQLEADNSQLRQLCQIDDLTQLANRRGFDRYLSVQWDRLATTADPLSLIFADIDCFKIYNDSYGSQAGDRCLQQVAIALYESLQHPLHLIARYGGTKFATILPQNDANDALQVAETMRVRVKALAIEQAQQHVGLPAEVVTVSLGVACTVPERESNPTMMIVAADDALSISKQQGGDRATLSLNLNFQQTRQGFPS
jgi:diguanylate cyclase (GGDEF)-like protein